MLQNVLDTMHQRDRAGREDIFCGFNQTCTCKFEKQNTAMACFKEY